MLKWIASKLASLIDNDSKVETFLNAVAGSCQDAEGFKRAVSVTFRAGPDEPPAPRAIKQEPGTVHSQPTPTALNATSPSIEISAWPPLATEPKPGQPPEQVVPHPAIQIGTSMENGMQTQEKAMQTASMEASNGSDTARTSAAAGSHAFGLDVLFPPAVTNGASDPQPTASSFWANGANSSANERVQHQSGNKDVHGIKRRHLSRSPDLPSSQKRTHASDLFDSHHEPPSTAEQGLTRAGSRTHLSLFASRESSPTHIRSDPQEPSSFNGSGKSGCTDNCLCKERRADGTTNSVDAPTQQSYARSVQPVTELMVAKLGFVFHSNGRVWSRNAITHLRQRVLNMPCHHLVTKVAKRGKPQIFDLSLKDGCQLETHLICALTKPKLTVAQRRQAIESILRRFVTVNKALFPEFELCNFPKIHSPA